MPSLVKSVSKVLAAQQSSRRPLAVILAGHNGSGKSTMWYRHLADHLQVPLVNADRMMMSVLPEVASNQKLPQWAATLRDTNTNWMKVSQNGVRAFVAHAMAEKVPFAMETVFSHWRDHGNGRIESKLDLITDMQAAGYFVVLLFVGLANSVLSIARVSTRVATGGHDVPMDKLVSRFPRTQRAIQAAAVVADATIMVDNSRTLSDAFTVCRIQLRDSEVYDLRRNPKLVPAEILAWLDVVIPQPVR